MSVTEGEDEDAAAAARSRSRSQSHSHSQSQISLFRSRIENRSFDGETLRILETVLAAKDVKSLTETRSSLKQFLRSKSLSFLREISHKTVGQKLLVLEFFVRAFALVGDIESCSALKYEALLFRDANSWSCGWLEVSCAEWLNFAEHLLDNGFYSVARQACESALLCLRKNGFSDAKAGESIERAQIVERINRLKDHAVKLANSCSVQAQAADYLKKKKLEKNEPVSSFCKGEQCAASTLFRNGIKKRNVRKLHEHRTKHQKLELSSSRSNDNINL